MRRLSLSVFFERIVVLVCVYCLGGSSVRRLSLSVFFERIVLVCVYCLGGSSVRRLSLSVFFERIVLVCVYCLQADMRLVCTDGMAFNFLYILQQLAVKVKVDKVDPFYPVNPKSRISIEDATRLNCSLNEATSWIAKLSEYLFNCF